MQKSGSDDFLRVFTIGIGNGASSALCGGVARVGNGVCYMTTRSEDVKDRCSKLLRAARALPFGCTTNLKVDWGYNSVEHSPPPPPEPKVKVPVNIFDESYNPLEKGEDIGPAFELSAHADVLQAPSKVPNLYPGNRFLVSAILTNTTQVPKKVMLNGTLPGGAPIQLGVDVAYVVTDENRPPMLHTLAAKRYIRELEDGDLSSLGISGSFAKGAHDAVVKAAVVEYGTRYSLASRYTSFVAVEKEKGESEKEKEKEKKTQNGQVEEQDPDYDIIVAVEPKADEKASTSGLDSDWDDVDASVEKESIREMARNRLNSNLRSLSASTPAMAPIGKSSPRVDTNYLSTSFIAQPYSAQFSGNSAPFGAIGGGGERGGSTCEILVLYYRISA